MSPAPEELLRKLLHIEHHVGPQYVSIDRNFGEQHLTLDTVVPLTDEEAEMVRSYIYGMGGTR